MTLHASFAALDVNNRPGSAMTFTLLSNHLPNGCFKAAAIAENELSVKPPLRSTHVIRISKRSFALDQCPGVVDWGFERIGVRRTAASVEAHTDDAHC